MKSFLKKRLSQRNINRLRILLKAYDEIKATIPKMNESFYKPIPVEHLKKELIQMGIASGDTIFLAASLNKLLFGGKKTVEKELDFSPIKYASDVLNMVFEIIGVDGTIIMNTESGLSQIAIAKIWAGVESDYIFNIKMHTGRGLIAELLRRKKGGIRSCYPFYNATAFGKNAEYLIKDHMKCSPYFMDENSPWYKLINLKAKGILLGNKFLNANILIYTLECKYKDDFPRPVFHNRPSKVLYIDNDGLQKDIEIFMLSKYAHNTTSIKNYGDYLIDKYPLYKIKEFSNNCFINVFDIESQLKIMEDEMKMNVTCHDPQFWY